MDVLRFTITSIVRRDVLWWLTLNASSICVGRVLREFTSASDPLSTTLKSDIALPG